MYFVALCFLLMLIFPTMYTTQRMYFMLVVFILSLNNCRLSISKDVRKWWFLTFVNSLFFIGYGLINGCPGAVPYMRLFLLWPILFLYVIARIQDTNFLDIIHRVIIFAGGSNMLITIIIIVNQVLFQFGPIQSLAEFYGFTFGMESGFLSFSSPVEDVAVYLFGYSLSYYLLNQNDKYRFFTRLTIFASVGVVLLSQSRGQWLLALATPFFIEILCKLTRRPSAILKFRYVFLFIIIGVALLFTIQQIFDVELLLDKFNSTFDFEMDQSNNERTQQFHSLTKDFLESPIVGHGLGWASAYVRSLNPWEYEMVYNYIFACCGVIGFSVYLLSIVWIYKTSIKILRSDNKFNTFLFPQIIGLTIMLCANETNPYLMKLDFLWVLYLPILTINMYLTNKSKLASNSINS